MKKKTLTIGSIIAILISIAIAFVILMPYIWMLLVSFKSTTEIMTYPGKFLPVNWVLTGYITVLTKSPFFKWFLNSALVTGSVTLLVLFTSSITGFVFGKFQFKFKDTLFWIILVTMMVPFQVTMIPNFLVINQLGLYDSLSALVIPVMISGFGIFLCKQFCEDIPDSLCEAARIDGAGDFLIFIQIITPLLKPCLAALAIFTFLDSWNDYLRPLIMIEQIPRMTLPVALSFFTSQHSNDLSAVMAAASLIMTPVTIVFLCFQKSFIKGITMTGIK